jgi:hypothetical protein
MGLLLLETLLSLKSSPCGVLPWLLRPADRLASNPVEQVRMRPLQRGSLGPLQVLFCVHPTPLQRAALTLRCSVVSTALLLGGFHCAAANSAAELV